MHQVLPIFSFFILFFHASLLNVSFSNQLLDRKIKRIKYPKNIIGGGTILSYVKELPKQYSITYEEIFTVSKDYQVRLRLKNVQGKDLSKKTKTDDERIEMYPYAQFDSHQHIKSQYFHYTTPTNPQKSCLQTQNNIHIFKMHKVSKNQPSIFQHVLSLVILFVFVLVLGFYVYCIRNKVKRESQRKRKGVDGGPGKQKKVESVDDRDRKNFIRVGDRENDEDGVMQNNMLSIHNLNQYIKQ